MMARRLAVPKGPRNLAGGETTGPVTPHHTQPRQGRRNAHRLIPRPIWGAIIGWNALPVVAPHTYQAKP